ncbi:acyl-CoA dehydrogenase family protein [Pseudomonas sp. Marseille-QA0892]
MDVYRPPLDDMRFVLEHWLDAPAHWARTPAFCDLDVALAVQVLDEAGRFASAVLAPLNASGDREGCRLVDGRVKTPRGFPEAYAAYVDAGWPSLACEVEDGGQGLPGTLDAALQEMVYGANHGWAMYTGLSHGAYQCLKAHAPAFIRTEYLPGIVSGEILPTMCLTEPQAGSDLGLLRCRAEPEGDAYRLTGTKRFISGGDHDLTDNILHLVLARLPDAPAGTRGLSLFAVPRSIQGAANGVVCEAIEHKMGIKGSATCELVFEQACGWLVGEANKGLAAMFVMMNSARLHVGLQGLGHAESALQAAEAYAFERRQMRAPHSLTGERPAMPDLISCHPAIRRTLLDLRGCTEGMRAVGYWAADLIDAAGHAETTDIRQQASELAGLLTPMIKAFFTEKGFLLASDALQVFGGYGYTADYSIEQTLRDSRIGMIYEGTNEIQAIDLVVRKINGDGGAAYGRLLGIFESEAATGCEREPDRPFAERYLAQCDSVRALLRQLLATAESDPEYPYRIAQDFLRMTGMLSLGYAWLRTLRCLPDRESRWAHRKYESARHFFTYLWPDVIRFSALIEAGLAPLGDVDRD